MSEVDHAIVGQCVGSEAVLCAAARVASDDVVIKLIQKTTNNGALNKCVSTLICYDRISLAKRCLNMTVNEIYDYVFIPLYISHGINKVIAWIEKYRGQIYSFCFLVKYLVDTNNYKDFELLTTRVKVVCKAGIVAKNMPTDKILYVYGKCRLQKLDRFIAMNNDVELYDAYCKLYDPRRLYGIIPGAIKYASYELLEHIEECGHPIISVDYVTMFTRRDEYARKRTMEWIGKHIDYPVKSSKVAQYAHDIGCIDVMMEYLKKGHTIITDKSPYYIETTLWYMKMFRMPYRNFRCDQTSVQVNKLPSWCINRVLGLCKINRNGYADILDVAKVIYQDPMKIISRRRFVDVSIIMMDEE